MSDPFQDNDYLDLASLPQSAASLLVKNRAPARLVAHLRLVHDVALRLLGTLLRTWPGLEIDREAVLFGAATHDIGKALHPDELLHPGIAHEKDGRRLLIDLGIEDRLARFAETHALWKDSPDCTLEDLVVALADTCWKGKRSERLEEMVCNQILAQIPAEPWVVFSSLDSIIDGLASDGDQRLAWQAQY